MDRDELRAYLSGYLEIRVDLVQECDEEPRLRVTLLLEKDEISRDSVALPARRE